MNNEEDEAEIMTKEEMNTMKKECSQEQEKGNILEMAIEIFEHIMRDYAIELNAMQKDVKKRKKETKKKEKGNRRLQDGSKKHENALKKKDVEF